MTLITIIRLAALVGEDEDSPEEEKGGPLVPAEPVKMEGVEVDLSAAVKAEVAERAKEMRAAEMRARVSLEERTETFKAMLLEREVCSKGNLLVCEIVHPKIL